MTIKELYDRVFDEEGNVKPCGRSKCIALIRACNNEYGGSFGDVNTGMMDIRAIKEVVRR